MMLVHRIIHLYNTRTLQFQCLSTAMFWERQGEEQYMWEALLMYAEHEYEAAETFATFDDEDLTFLLGNRVPIFIVEAKYDTETA